MRGSRLVALMLVICLWRAPHVHADLFPAPGGDTNTGLKTALYLVIRDDNASPLSQSRTNAIRTLETTSREFYAVNSGGTFDMAFTHILDVPIALNVDGRRPSNWRTLAENYVQTTYGLNPANFHSNIFDVNATTADENQGWAGVYWGGTNDFAIQADISTSWGKIVMDHELGHRVGADHANAYRSLNDADFTPYVWNPTAQQYQEYNQTTHGYQVTTLGMYKDEYGNPFDTMGNVSHGQFRIREKVSDLGWLTNTQVPDLTTLGAGTYRVYAHDDLDLATSPTGVYGVVNTYDPNLKYGLTYQRAGETFNSTSGQWQSATQRIDIEYRVGRDGVQFYLDGGIVDVDSEGGTSRNNLERELEVGKTLKDIDISRSFFSVGAVDEGEQPIDFLSFSPAAPTDWANTLSNWFEFKVLATGSDGFGAYADLMVTISQLLNGVAGDIDQDGGLTRNDVAIFSQNWLLDTSPLVPYERWKKGDLTQNGLVDLADWFELWKAYNHIGINLKFGEPLAVPEPSTALLAGCAACSAFTIFRCRYRATTR